MKSAARARKGVIVAPIAFVSEHSETLVELDMDYLKLAKESGVPDYLRAPTVGCASPFIAALADLGDARERGQRWSAAGQFVRCGLAPVGFGSASDDDVSVEQHSTGSKLSMSSR